MSTVYLKKGDYLVKKCETGFSFTFLFFNFFVLAYHRDIKHMFMYITYVLLWALGDIYLLHFAAAPVNGVSFILSNLALLAGCLIWAFMYNDIYINSLLEDGYEPLSDNDRNILAARPVQ